MGLYYLCGENKDVNKLLSKRTADLRLSFRICRLMVFLCGGSILALVYVCGNLAFPALRLLHLNLLVIVIFKIFNDRIEINLSNQNRGALHRSIRPTSGKHVREIKPNFYIV